MEEASLWCENSQLEREIQRLKRKLQVLHELYQEHILLPPRTLFGEEMHGLATEKKLSSLRRMGAPRGRFAASCCRVQGILFREKRAREGGVALC